MLPMLLVSVGYAKITKLQDSEIGKFDMADFFDDLMFIVPF